MYMCTYVRMYVCMYDIYIYMQALNLSLATAFFSYYFVFLCCFSRYFVLVSCLSFLFSLCVVIWLMRSLSFFLSVFLSFCLVLSLCLSFRLPVSLRSFFLSLCPGPPRQNNNNKTKTNDKYRTNAPSELKQFEPTTPTLKIPRTASW